MSMIQRGVFLTKEAPLSDAAVAEQHLTALHKELGDIVALLETTKKEANEQFTALTNHYSGVKATSDELKAAVTEHTKKYSELITKQQMLEQALDQVKREMDTPLMRGGNDLAENDKKAAIELQRRTWLHKGGAHDEFEPDMDNLVDAKSYRSAVRKLVKYVGIEPKRKVVASMLTELERKAFDNASLDAAIFSPEILGIELNCITECAGLLDLYNTVTVSKSTFMYPQVLDYGQIGKYDCDAKCDAEFGEEGNITYKSGQINDFRGVFCFQRKVLAEANYDLLSFMYQAAARSYRINRDRALMVGDGVNEPQGWLTANCFTKLKTGGTSFSHVDFRMFYASVPVEYGPAVAVMHQNVFAYLATLTDGVGRFIFGDGLMTYSPTDVRENIRISNCLPDATYGMTKGNAANPFITGDFLCAIGAWTQAFYAVNKRPLWIEQWDGQSSAWCVKYQLGAEDGGFVACCPAVRLITVGP